MFLGEVLGSVSHAIYLGVRYTKAMHRTYEQDREA